MVYEIEDIPVLASPQVSRLFKDLTGLKFERLTVLERKENNKWRESTWLCKCNCGNIIIVRGKDLLTKNTNSCGCFRNDRVREAYKDGRVLTNCLHCNKSFYVKLSQVKVNGNYCSYNCMSFGFKEKFAGENNPNHRHGECGTVAYNRKMGDKWRLNNKDKIRYHNRRSKLIRKAVPGFHSHADILNKFKDQWNSCYWCFEPLHDYHVDHIIPISKGGTNNPDNICIACPACNMQKSDKLPEEWINSENYRGKRKHVTITTS